MENQQAGLAQHPAIRLWGKGVWMYVTSPPIAVQKALFAVLGPLARALRYQPQYGV